MRCVVVPFITPMSVCGLVIGLTWNLYAQTGLSGKSKAPEIRNSAKGRFSHDLTKMSFLDRQIYISARSGVTWLLRANGPDGRFINGLEPALRARMARENFLHQAAATFALARAARFFKDERAAAVARQAALTLFLATEKDANKPQSRRVVLDAAADALEAAGWLVMIVHELPEPGGDLLAKSTELCNFIRSRQSDNGSFRCVAGKQKSQKLAVEKKHPSTGTALYGLMAHLRHRKQPSNLQAVTKALRFHRKEWRKHKTTEFIPWHSAAYAEAYWQTNNKEFADFVNELNDWLCTLQNKDVDVRHPNWQGGFRNWRNGRPQPGAPNVHSAAFVEALAQGCRIARKNGDLSRFKKYQKASAACCRFVMRLQYTTANTQHFADWYRRDIIGGFHSTHQDGKLRIDYSQKAVCGLIRHLAGVAQIR